MRARFLVLAIAVALVTSACSAEQGVLLPGCEPNLRNPTGATILALQAVPGAKYTPCIESLPLGWDTVDFDSERGMARIEFSRLGRIFLDAGVTETCDVGGASEVDGPTDDVRKFENVEFSEVDIGVTIVPSGQRPLLRSRMVVDDLEGTEIEDRPLVITIDERVEESVSSRVNLARLHGDYVWIIDELDAEEGTLEMRGPSPVTSGAGISVNQALDLIEDSVDDVFYRGEWFYTFEGGCITYTFDAKGRVAETIAADAAVAIGFYPAAELRKLGEAEGFDFGP